MTGWAILAGLGALSLLLLCWPGRLDRGGLMLAAAAVFVAAAGYAWQGSPGEAGAPAFHATPSAMKRDTLFAIERQRLLNRYGETGQWLGTADAMNRWGDDAAAVGYMRGAVLKYPRDADLWIGYAHALFMQADGNITPAAMLAFDRAQALEPANPAPGYFRGLMALEAGDVVDTERRWRALYAGLPQDSMWKTEIGERLRGFDMVRAMQARGQ
jgi:cytochrome c-type biogenesis protein CcmH/NrfG